MKLLSCNISGFGGLSNFSVDFNENPAVFYERNGFGKSTLADFIKVMLYGMSTAKRGAKDFDDRTHYCPFGGGAFGGSLTLESGGAVYRIERQFDKKSETRDTLLFTDGQGAPVPVPDEGIGEHFFGIDCESFVRTVYISRDEVEAEATSSINRKLNNLVDGTAKENDFDKVVKNLTRAYKEIRADRGREGSYYAALDELARSEVEASSLRAVDSALSEKYGRLNALAGQIKERTAEYDRAVEQRALQGYWERYDGVMAEIAEKSAAAAAIAERYPAGFPTKEECDGVREAYRRKLNAEGKEQSAVTAAVPSDERLADIEKRCASYSSLKGETEELKRRLGGGVNKTSKPMPVALIIVLLLLGLIAVGAGVVLGHFKSRLFFILAGAGGLLAVFAIISFAVRGRKMTAYGLEQEYVQWAEELARVERNLNELFAAYRVTAADIPSSLARLKESVDAHKTYLRQANEELYSCQSAITAFYEKYFIEPTDSLWNDVLAVEKDLSAYAALAGEIDRKKKEAEAYRTAKRLTLRPDGAPADIPALEDGIRSMRKEYSLAEADIAADERAVSVLPATEERIKELSAKAESLSKRYELIKKTLYYIRAAEDGLKERYITPVKDYYLSLSSAFSPEVSKNVSMNFNYNLLFEDGGVLRGDEYFSSGQRRCAELCLRLALIKNMYKDEAPFVIMDDPFVNLDEAHLESAKNLLRKAAEDIQIIYFCCHQSRLL